MIHGNRYIVVPHRGVGVSTVVGNSDYDTFINDSILNSEIMGVLPNALENRPDNISFLMYDTPDNWWLLMEVNNVSDPFEGFIAGQDLRGVIVK